MFDFDLSWTSVILIFRWLFDFIMKVMNIYTYMILDAASADGFCEEVFCKDELECGDVTV